MTLKHLNLSDIERSNSRSPGFQTLISGKGSYLDLILQLNIIGNHANVWGVYNAGLDVNLF